MGEAVDFQVRKSDLRESRFAPLAPASEAELADGEVLVAVERFAFTANNVTYAVFGEAMNYWGFFPAEEGWGRIPVWGFGEVLRSNADGIEVGERLYGYFPMSSWVILKPTRIARHGFADGAEHRLALHPVYNQYQRVAADPGYTPATEPAQMILRPLFATSFLIDDFLADADFFGARQVIITSASSKTSLALAHQVHALRRGKVEVVGLTSPSNRQFCEGLGIYDRVLAYEDLETLDGTVPSVAVDMAGNGSVLRRIHEHFDDALKYSCLVGGTHWEARSGGGDLPGPAPTLFFAPDQMKKRNADWGAEGYNQRLGEAWTGFVAASAAWLDVHEDRGEEAVQRIYLETLDGRVDPRRGQILSLA
ncbi:MAG TPA: DUF2855 family protein [Pseudomonadales bacterium]|nr:DUF2855 family protein [Pseudomonadales bacterium]